MSDFVVRYRIAYRICTSKVYAVDTDGDNFLVVDLNGEFLWVPISDCTLVRDEFDTEE